MSNPFEVDSVKQAKNTMPGCLDTVKLSVEGGPVNVATPGPVAGSSVRVALLAAAREELIARGPGAISLRAVARRAGVSHAAPKHHFDDRAGLLTALAVEGFDRLRDVLLKALDSAGPASSERLTALGRAYLDFGLAEPALFELMFRPDQLHADDEDLRASQVASFGVLAGAVDTAAAWHTRAEPDRASLSLIAWAFVHGLVVLARSGALEGAVDRDVASADLARHLTSAFTASLRPGLVNSQEA
jgi:AcrR family transcriptional regulator